MNDFPKLKLCSTANYPWLNTNMTLITDDNFIIFVHFKCREKSSLRRSLLLSKELNFS